MTKKKIGRCPLCKAASAAKFSPFCSQRCADADLARWLNGQYRVPAEDEPDEDGPQDPNAPPAPMAPGAGRRLH
ncbi:MAG: DNA gyrase inhibitor YacG [Alphaproteobacteria bacterium]